MVNHTRCGDQFVGRIRPKVQASGCPGHRQINRPHVKRRERAHHFCGVQHNLQLPELLKLGQLPEDDCRDTPRIAGEKSPLASCNTMNAYTTICVSRFSIGLPSQSGGENVALNFDSAV